MKIKKNDYLNKCLHTTVKKEFFKQKEKRTFYAPINLIEKYVQIIYPVREDFIKQFSKNEVLYINSGFDNYYEPFENNKVEFSTFINTPHKLEFYSKFIIKTQNSQKYQFTLSTCGRVVIFVNGIIQEDFAPFTRNIETSKNIFLNLNDGENEIVIYAIELAERDVFFYYKLKYIDELDIEYFVNINDEENVKNARDLIMSCSFKEDLINTGIITIIYDPHLVDTQEYYLTKYEDNNNYLNIKEDGSIFKINFSKEKNEIEIDVSSLKSFSQAVSIVCKINQYHLKKRFVISNLEKQNINIENLEERKKYALEYLEKYGNTNVNKAIAIFEIKKKYTDEAKKCIETALEMIHDKGDCADFYLAPLLLIYVKYKHYLPEEMIQKIKKEVLNFRYWIDEPGDDVMWYFSENHAFLFHLAQYIAGDLFQKEIFKVSKKTGLEQKEIGKQRLVEWFDLFNKYGLAEWNSTTYLPIDLIGLFCLYELAPDKEIKDFAQSGLDFSFEIMAANLQGDMVSCSYGRCYEKELKAMEFGELTFITWIALNKGYINTSSRSTILYAISTYKQKDLNHLLNSKNQSLLIEYKQGINQVYTYNFKNDDYSLASVINYHSTLIGHQQHIMNISLGNENTQIWINHPGELVPSGENRPSYWAGNKILPRVEQYKNTMYMQYLIDENIEIDFIHMYLPSWKLDEIIINENSVFIKKDNTYLYIWFKNKIQLEKNNANRNKEIRSYGKNHEILIKTSSQKECLNFQNFINIYQNFKIKNNQFNDNQYGVFEINEKFMLLNNEIILRDADYKIRVIKEKGDDMIQKKIELLANSFEKILYEEDEIFLKGLDNLNIDEKEKSKYKFWEWTQGVGLYGYFKLFKITNDQKYLNTLKKYFEQRISEGLPSKNINTICPMLTMVFLYEYDHNLNYLEIIKEWALWIYEKLPRTKYGGFQHITSDTENKDELWDDTLFMSVLFLCKAGKILKKEKYIEEAKYQFLFHIKYLTDTKTGLWYHGFTFTKNHNFVNALWGRGNSWITIAIPEFLEILNENNAVTRFLESSFKEQAEALKIYQDDSGLWHTLINDETSYLESSATAGIIAGLQKGQKMKIIENYDEVIDKGINAICNKIDEFGILNDVSYGTAMGRESLDFYKKIHLHRMPYGQAMVLLALIEKL